MAIRIQQRREHQRNQNKYGRLTPAPVEQRERAQSVDGASGGVFSEREQTKEEFPRAVMLYNLGIKRQLNQEKAIRYFKDKAREIREQNKQVPAGAPYYDREVFDFIAQRNDNDIAILHADQMARGEAAQLAHDRFEQEAEELIQERKVPMTDSFSGKYDLMAAKKKLKNVLRADA